MRSRLSERLRWVRDFLAHPALNPSSLDSLEKLAVEPSPNHWKPGAPLSQVNNCHFTNRPGEMRQGLTDNYNFLEGDIRFEGGFRRIPGVDHWREPILGHDTTAVDGLNLDEWLDIGKASGRGLKLDIKQAAAVPQILEKVKAHDIPDEWVMFNGDVVSGPGAPKARTLVTANVLQDLTMDVKDLREIRRQFPYSWISLGFYTHASPEGTTYSDQQLDKIAALADQVGGRISFPLRAEFVTQAAVDRLKPHGAVSVWNDPANWAPADVAKETQRLRDMGVDGVIDLRPMGSTL